MLMKYYTNQIAFLPGLLIPVVCKPEYYDPQLF